MQRLQKEHRKQAGISDTPTGAMYSECQELLQMFGLPYIIAPMEVLLSQASPQAAPQKFRSML